jgi:hypothetical protein
MKLKHIANLASICLIAISTSCSSNSDDKYSRTTGWAYNDKTGTGFTVKPNFETQTPSGMVAIEGGSFTVGEKGEFITAPRDNMPRRVTVSSFYMDQYEIRNMDWREYTSWMKVVFGKTAPKLVAKTQPDFKCWREELAYNEPYLENYFTHPAFITVSVADIVSQYNVLLIFISSGRNKTTVSRGALCNAVIYVYAVNFIAPGNSSLLFKCAGYIKAMPIPVVQ